MPNTRKTTERVAPVPALMREQNAAAIRRLPPQDSGLLQENREPVQSSRGLSRAVLRAINQATDLADGMGHQATGIGHLLMALLQSEEAGLDEFLGAFGLRTADALAALLPRIEPGMGGVK